MQLVRAFQYKKWANDELLQFGERQFSRLPDSDANFFVRILNHTTIVDSLFISRILGQSEKYKGDNTIETPILSELRQVIEEHDSWLVHFSESVTPEQLRRSIGFRFTDGYFGRMSVEEILLHLITHSSNHRGMASRVLAENGLERPKDTFTRYLHQMEPARRQYSGT